MNIAQRQDQQLNDELALSSITEIYLLWNRDQEELNRQYIHRTWDMLSNGIINGQEVPEGIQVAAVFSKFDPSKNFYDRDDITQVVFRKLQKMYKQFIYS